MTLQWLISAEKCGHSS